METSAEKPQPVIITGRDSLENAVKAQEVIFDKFPYLNCGIFSSFNGSNGTSKANPDGHVLIQVEILPETPPEFTSPDLMKTWSDSLQDTG